jgi:hypothetical protein
MNRPYALGLWPWASLLAQDAPGVLRAAEQHGEEGHETWPLALALGTLSGVTVVVATGADIPPIQHRDSFPRGNKLYQKGEEIIPAAKGSRKSSGSRLGCRSLWVCFS